MKNCPACREKIQDEAIRCKHCGTDLDEQKCPWCAEIVEKDAKKCKHCKSYLDKMLCGACGKHADPKEMKCATCFTETLEHELAIRTKKEHLKMRLKSWVSSAIILGLAIFALIKIFG